VDAEWITKEKLTLMTTKEDTKDQEADRKPAATKSNDHKVQLAPEHELLGKHSKLLRIQKWLSP
jgi:hypothetical protein